MPYDIEPINFEEAMSDIDSDKWLEAMRYKMNPIEVNQVRALVDPPKGIKLIRSKWVFKRKSDIDGNVQMYKAKLVAKGYNKVEGSDYEETFSLVAMVKSI